jgi:hypothetical protein
MESFVHPDPCFGDHPAEARDDPTGWCSEVLPAIADAAGSTADLEFLDLAVGPDDAPWLLSRGLNDWTTTRLVRWNRGAWSPVVTEERTFPHSIVVTPQGEAILAFDHGGTVDEPPSQNPVHIVRSAGDHWSSLGEALTRFPAPEARIGPATLALDRSGMPLVAWGEHAGDKVKVYVSRWSGTAWLPLGGAVDEAASGQMWLEQPSLAIDGEGRPVVAWLHGGSVGLRIGRDPNIDRLRVARWDGRAWKDLGPDGGVPCALNPANARLVIDGLGPLVTFGGGLGSEGKHGMGAMRWDGARWNVVPTPAHSTNRAMAVLSDGSIAFAWMDFVDQSFRVDVARLTSNGWLWVVHDARTYEGQRPSSSETLALAAGAKGSIYLAWNDPLAAKAKSRVARLTPCKPGEKPHASPLLD